MKTPDGYCAWHPDKGFLTHTRYNYFGCAQYEVHDVIVKKVSLTLKMENESWQIKPVCLVDPRLMDWVEKVRRAYYDHSSADSFLDDMGQLVDVELKEITGEG